ncbi:MAG: hypothetical protein H3C35_11085 [Bacteroidetes bacterium]|nr:hypothetical protein [Bacteroidota bacterium]
MKQLQRYLLLQVLFSIPLFSQEISNVYLNQALNVSVESEQMQLLDQLSLETGIVFPINARPITQREWYSYVFPLLAEKSISISKNLREKLAAYKPNFRFREKWYIESYGRIGFETVFRENQNLEYLTRYEERTPLARISFQASRDTAFGFAVQLRLQNTWPVYLHTNYQTNLPRDIRDDLDYKIFHKAYFSYQTNKITFQFGRDNLRWGTGERASTFLSNNAPYFDFIKFVLWFTKVKFSTAYVSLVDYEPAGGIRDPAKVALFDKPERNMILQRVEWNFLPQVSAGFSYMKIIFGRSPKLDDINPFIFQHNLFKDYQNSLMSADVVWGVVPGVQLYGEITSDDIRSSSDTRYDDVNAPTTIAYQAGVKGYTRGWKGVVEYVYLPPLMYNFLFKEGRAVDYDGSDYKGTPGRDVLTRALGHWLPVDSKNIYFSLEKELSYFLKVKSIIERRRKGERTISSPYPQTSLTISGTPTGIVQQTDIAGIGGQYLSASFDLRSMLYYYRIENYRNITEQNKKGMELQASIGYRIF